MPAPEPVRLGRKRPVPSCPNPLFLQWLTELRDDAKEKGLKIHYTYQKAINSLNKYPLPLKNAKEAKILQNFGDGICKLLDDRLQKYYRQHGPDASIHILPETAPPAVRFDNNNLAPTKKKSVPSNGESEKGGGGERRKKKREYVPQKRSGGYAVLLALYRHCQVEGSKGYMFKLELQTEAQPLCDKSFSVPDLGSKYTAWSSVSTLIQKNLLLKTHNPARYSLTDEGKALAERLDSAERRGGGGGGEGHKGKEEERGGGGEKVPHRDADAAEEDEEALDLTQSDEEETEDEVTAADKPGAAPEPRPRDLQPKDPDRCLLPGSYEILLCVDFIETTGGGNVQCKQELVKELQRNGVNFDVRKLNVGDFLWVAREKKEPVPGQLRAPCGRELVLDYIVERKRIDDLCGSIIDGRFREQKFRLKRCGLRRPVYLVEECGAAAAHLSLPESTLQQAIVNTQVVDGFFVKRVQDVRESAAYLTVMTRYLSKLYKNRALVTRSRELEGDLSEDQDVAGNPSCSLISFAEFNHGAVKNKCQTVREVFARQLMQISGLSGDKAAAIIQEYPTPHSLLTAYDRCSNDLEREKLLSSIRCGKLKRNLGPALSRTVYQLYCTKGPLT
ncbi:crossover junction endonuclease MUS81 isoform X1 [Boleophthalmus pectinirostris]|uniref:crossover junction endonuclease MUS81 isoform X1 n=1 Tax=Boleophthalmus pectinirostris TaxID=150288 RepID=UPI00242F2B0B|nr:crossover junction endonuclease MUS81 isoform X1 [Boleophthalmus pectinirostris]